jgi:hypothetical protein
MNGPPFVAARAISLLRLGETGEARKLAAKLVDRLIERLELG